MPSTVPAVIINFCGENGFHRHHEENVGYDSESCQGPICSVQLERLPARGHTDRDGNRGSRRRKGGTKDTGTIMERGQYVRSDDE